eukprot:4815802-Amphidinium_carterae.1
MATDAKGAECKEAKVIPKCGTLRHYISNTNRHSHKIHQPGGIPRATSAATSTPRCSDVLEPSGQEVCVNHTVQHNFRA